MVRAVFTTIALLFAFSLAGPVAAAEDLSRLSGREILARSAKAGGVTLATSQGAVHRAILTEHGLSETVTAISQPPNKLVTRVEFPWLHLIQYSGFDGHRAWTSTNLAGAGPASPAGDELIRSEAAYYNDADIFPDRWDVHVERRPDAAIHGGRYFQIYEKAKGGNPVTLYIDRSTYLVMGASFAPLRYDWCLKTVVLRGRSFCTLQEVHWNGALVGTFSVTPATPYVADATQFEMPVMLHDDTTQWVLDRYAAAVHEPATLRSAELRGNTRLHRYQNDTVFATFDWILEMGPALAYSNRIYRGDRTDYRSEYDGRGRGTVSYGGPATDAAYQNGLLARVYARCELHAVACGVTVTRLANVTFDERRYYALGVTSQHDASAWYTLLIDRQTYLPYLAWTPGMMVTFENYRIGSDATPIPETWHMQTIYYEEIVTGVGLRLPH